MIKNTPIVKPPSNTLKKIPWKEIVKECHDKSLGFSYPVVKVIYTDDKAERAVILEKPDKTYTIAYETLIPFDDDELKYSSDGLHGFWNPNKESLNSVFDTEERAEKAVFCGPPFKYNKSVLWADSLFRIDVINLWWINCDDADDPNDLCLHGHVIAKIGDEYFEYDATVSATGLYLLRTLTKNHIMHEDDPILPCCGHLMIANDDLTSANIVGCPNGIAWSVVHDDGRIKLITEANKETIINLDDYMQEVYAFADKIKASYEKCSPKNLSETDAISQDGYTAFWNEWHRCREAENIMAKRT